MADALNPSRGDEGDSVHRNLSPSEARDRGCTCEFGCRACGYPLARMDVCPAFRPCASDTSKIGRAPDPTCPLTTGAVHARA